jgi:hypothetical protein
MAVMMPREAWTDERLGDLNARVESLDRRIEEGVTLILGFGGMILALLTQL